MRLAELEAEKARLQEAARRDEEERERERLARLREELVREALVALCRRPLLASGRIRTRLEASQRLVRREMPLLPTPCLSSWLGG